jgi:uncharacterized damage-inducible protein DinB
MIDYLERQFVYDAWANREVIGALQVLSNPPAQAIGLLAHILSAEKLWLQRLQSQPQSYPVWPDFTLQQCDPRARELQQLWPQYLSTLTERSLAGTVAYKNTKGEDWTSRCGDILQHVIIHSAHHRGQIVALIRASGHVPPPLDFIHAVRQGFLT